jgi:hypothetical protein
MINRSQEVPMSTEYQSSSGVVLDTSLIFRSVRYYAIIGAGLGLLGLIFLLQLGGGEEGGMGLVSGLLSLVVLAFAVLCGPIIASFIAYATAESGIGDIRTRSVNSGIANGIGFAVFGVVVVVILFVGLALLSTGGDGGASSGGGSSAPMEIGNLITPIILMMIPNSLVGGAITFFLEGRGGASP